MKFLIILFITSSIYGQSDFILPSDFVDSPPNLPNVVLPSFDDNSDSEVSIDTNLINSVKGYRIQVAISQNEKDLIDIKEKLEVVVKEKIYINTDHLYSNSFYNPYFFNTMSPYPINQTEGTLYINLIDIWRGGRVV